MKKQEQEYVIVVDENDQELGKMEKILAHQKGVLHRAFSVFIFNEKGEFLLQQRADEKYHSAGLWTNTCCSHPRPNEPIKDAVKRRLSEEMGMECTIHHAFSFLYKASLENNLAEHEYDHVFFGKSNTNPILNKTEAKDWKYMNLEDLERDLAQNQVQYTAWLAICLPQVKEHFKSFYSNETNSNSVQIGII